MMKERIIEKIKNNNVLSIRKDRITKIHLNKVYPSNDLITLYLLEDTKKSCILTDYGDFFDEFNLKKTNNLGKHLTKDDACIYCIVNESNINDCIDEFINLASLIK